MKLFIFTFGLAHVLKNKYQPIMAPNAEKAINAMVDNFGSRWACYYTIDDFNSYKENGIFLNLKPLKVIFVEEVA